MKISYDSDRPGQLWLNGEVKQIVPVPQQLSDEQWDAVNAAERRLYSPNMGVLPLTDVVPNDGTDNGMLAEMWEHALRTGYHYDGESYADSVGSHRTLHMIAKRVAQATMVLSVGAESLLK